MFQICKNFLIKINFEAVEDGENAVKQFEDRNKTLNSNIIHVIILDLNMKRMDGNIAA